MSATTLDLGLLPDDARLRPRVWIGHTVTARAQIRDAARQPAAAAGAVTFLWRSPANLVVELPGTAVPGRIGLFECSYLAPVPGEWAVRARSGGDGPRLEWARFTVVAEPADGPIPEQAIWLASPDTALVGMRGMHLAGATIPQLPELGTPQDMDALPAVRGGASGRHSWQALRLGAEAAGAAAGSSAVSAHAGRTDNPHGTTDAQVQFSADGALAAPRTIREKLRERLSLFDLGVRADGTDQSARLNQIFAAYGRRTYLLPGGTAPVEAAGARLTLPAGATLEMDGDADLCIRRINVEGSVSAAVPLTQAAPRGSNTILFDTSAFSPPLVPGEWVWVRGCVDLLTTHAGADQLGIPNPVVGDGIYAGDYVRLESVGAGQATFFGGLTWDYTLSPSPGASRAVSTVQRVTWATGTIRGGRITAGAADAWLIQSRFARNLRVEGVTWEIGAVACRVWQDIHGLDNRLLDPTVRRAMRPSGSINNSFYVAGSIGWEARNPNIDGGNQAFDFGYEAGGMPARFGRVIGGLVRNAFEVGTTHQGAPDCSFIGVSGENVTRGLRLRSPRGRAIGCQMDGAGSTGIGYLVSEGFTDGCQIASSTAIGFLRGFDVDGAAGQGPSPLPYTVRITDCEAVDCVEPVRTRAGPTALRRAAVIRGGRLSRMRGSGGWVYVGPYANGTVVEGMEIEGPWLGADRPSAGVLLDANARGVRIGTNTHIDLGANVAAVRGPGLILLTDSATFPAGDTSAGLVVDPQILRGVDRAMERVALPVSMAAGYRQDAYGERSQQGRFAARAIPGQVAAPIAVQDAAAATDLLGISPAGRLTGSVADGVAVALGNSGLADGVLLALAPLFQSGIVIFNSLRGARDGLNFASGTYRRGLTATTTISTLPGWSFARADAATADDAAGVRQGFGAGVPRLTDTGLGVYEAGTNLLRNGNAVGAVVGAAPNTGRPSNWQPAMAAGLQYEIVAAGTIAGRTSYIDWLISGTPSGLAPSAISFDASTAIGAAQSEWIALACDLAIVGTAVNLGSVRLAMAERASGGGGLAARESDDLALSATLARPALIAQMGNAATAHVQGQIAIRPAAAGTPMSVVLRTVHPQLRRNARASIPYVPTSGSVAASCAADLATLAVPQYPGEMTLFAEAAMNEADAQVQVLAQWDDGTDASRIVLQRNASGAAVMEIIAGGVSVYQRVVAGRGGARTLRLALRLSALSLGTCVDGEAVVTVARPATLPTGLTTWRMGRSVAGDSLNGVLRAVLAWDRALPDDEMRAVVAL